MWQLLVEQLSDPFRIGLVAALVVTTLNTAHHTGRAVPLAIGVLFVAVLIPTAFRSGETALAPAIAMGIVANALILAVVLGAVLLWSRLTARGG